MNYGLHIQSVQRFPKSSNAGDFPVDLGVHGLISAKLSVLC